MASMRELAMELLSRSGTGPVLQPTNVYGQDPDLPIGYGEGEISPLDAAAISTMLVPGVGDVTGLAADVDMYMRDPESRNIPNYLLTAAGALPFLPAASQVRKGIKAYHGSPHSFDRFSTEQIGTGEGAQAYGQGLYFAGNEKVAEGYKGSTNYADKKRRFQKELPDDASIEEVMELVEEGVFSDDLNELLMALEADDWLGFDYPSQAISASLSGNLKNYDASPRLVKATESGSMYEVNIDVEPDELIDWDAPVGDQPKAVQEIVEAYKQGGDQSLSLKERFGLPFDPTDEQIMKRAVSAPGVIEQFKESGIKGVKYADAFTRHKTPDKRSMNYVIFDDRLITIAKKYGIAIPAAAAMLARMTGEDTSQSYQEET